MYASFCIAQARCTATKCWYDSLGVHWGFAPDLLPVSRPDVHPARSKLSAVLHLEVSVWEILYVPSDRVLV